MAVDVYAPLAGIVGVVFGAALQYFFTRRVDSAKHYRELRTQAYVEFAKAVAGRAVSQRLSDKQQELSFTILLADVKARLAIYGSRQVVTLLATLLREHEGALALPLARQQFMAVLNQMRAEVPNSGERLPTQDIAQLLFDEDD